MKEITYFSLRFISILLCGEGLLLLEELYHGIMATYYKTHELIAMTYPALVFVACSLILWLSARRLAAMFNTSRFDDLEWIHNQDFKEVIIHIMGILYVILLIPDLVLFLAQSLVYIDFMGLGYMSKVDLVVFIFKITIGFLMIKKSDFIVKILDKVIRPI
jgi:hypothetical protein